MAKNLAISNIQVNSQSVSTIPFSILAGDPFDVAWTVSNLGDELIAGGTAGSYIDSVYLSDDNVLDVNVLDVSDVVIEDYNDTTSLAAYTGSYSSRQRISILAGTSGTQYPQNKYLIFRANSSGVISESDLTDNTVVVPISVNNASSLSTPFAALPIRLDASNPVILQVPPSNLGVDGSDLIVTAFTAPKIAGVGTKVFVSWIVKNLGAVDTAIANSWYDSIYLSDDEVLGNDTYLGSFFRSGYSYREGSLKSGTEYSSTISVTMPSFLTTVPQNKYILVVTDSDNTLIETDETNNSRFSSAPISVVTPNITITAPTTPLAAVLGDKIPLTWTVKNDSSVASGSYWYDRVYLSDDQIFSTNPETDKLLFEKFESFSFGSTDPNFQDGHLAGGGQYTEVQDIRISQINESSGYIDTMRTAIGQKYLIFYTQGQQETNKDDNFQVVPITIIDKNLRADSIISTVGSVEFSKPFDVIWTATNIGDASVSGAWDDRIYLSRDKVLSNDDLLLSTKNISANLAKGDSYSSTATVVADMPKPLLVDANGYVSEIEENASINSALNLQQNFVQDQSVVYSDPLLKVYNVKVKGTSKSIADVDYFKISASLGDNIYINSISSNFSATIYDRNGVALTNGFPSYTVPTPGSLGGGTSYTGDYYVRVRYSGSIINTPYNFNLRLTTNKIFNTSIDRDGDYYLIAATDANNSLSESDEGNNLVSSVSTIHLGTQPTLPDLTIVGSTANTRVLMNGTFATSWTTTNINTSVTAQPGWFDGVYLSDDDKFDSNDLLLSVKPRGTSEAPLLPGASYSANSDVTLPTGLIGNKYLLFVADNNNSRAESNELNNVSAIPIQINAPDLVVSNIIATANRKTLTKGEIVELTWTITNQGAGDANGGWTDKIYLSNDESIGSDLLLGSFDYIGNIAAGQSVELHQIIALPVDINIENSRLLVSTDTSNRLAEGTSFETNNSSIDADPIQIINNFFPNLTVTSITLANTVLSGQNAVVTWQVTNSGNSPTVSPYWYDRIWLSQNEVFDATLDYLLAAVDNPTYLAPGESYANSATIQIPQGIESFGDQGWHVLVATDTGYIPAYFKLPTIPVLGTKFLEVTSNVDEDDKENDNVTASAAFIISPALLPDLQVTNVAVSPTSPFSGQKVAVTWTVENRGGGRTSPNESKWIDEVFLSKNPDGSGESYSLGRFSNVSSLAAASLSGASTSYSNTQQVDLPIGKWNEYFFVVKTDVENKVYEKAFESNNSGFLDANSQDTINTPSVINLTPAPDLTVVSISSSLNSLAAGKTINLTYKVINAGATEVPGRSSKWTDQFYLSPTADLNLATAKLIGELNVDRQGQAFVAGASYSNTITLTVPPELAAGDYYLIAYSDYENQVFEQDDVDEAVGGTSIALSNSKSTAQSITIVSTPADFVVTEVTEVGILNAGKTGRFSWTAINQGAGDSISTNWSDQLILSRNDILGDRDDINLGIFQNYGDVLASGGTYTRTQDITLPFTLNGNYNLFAVTDKVLVGDLAVKNILSNKVYESNENNNDTAAHAIVINRSTPDLAAQSIATSTANAAVGEKVAVTWNIKNIGDGLTNVVSWYDEVFLSADRVLDDKDVLVDTVRHNGAIAANEDYNANANLSMPLNVQGQYYLLVNSNNGFVIDDNGFRVKNPNRVVEISDSNNTIASANKINITAPNLAVTTVSADASGIGGQTLNVNWTVSNVSTAAAIGKWNDGIYLSRDRIFDRNSGDIFIGSVKHFNGLAGNGTYSVSTNFDIPRGLSGAYYVLAATDDGNAGSADGLNGHTNVYEGNNELDNINFTSSTTQIILPSPVDLAAIASSISFASTGVSGEPLTVNYQVKNQGGDTALGNWTDTVYLSKDEVWDVNDAVLGSFEHMGNVAPGSTYGGSVTANMPGLNPDSYHVIVRTDVRDVVPDTNIVNDLAVSTNSVSVDFATLNVGGSVTGNLGQGQAVYYKLQGVAGKTLRLRLDSADDSGANGLYVKYGAVPTRGQYDRTGNNPVDADQDVILPIGQDGTYYVMAYGNSVAGNPNFTLSATEVPFSISNVTTKVVGNVGKATVKVEGALFEEGTTFQLIDRAGAIIDQASDVFKSSTTDFATFDLKGKATGLYDLQATQLGGATTVVKGAVTVETGVGGAIDDTIIGPKTVLIPFKYPISVVYGNSGDTDTAAPLLIVRANEKAAIGLNAKFDNQQQLHKSLQIYGAGTDIGADQLRPQESHSVQVYFASLGEPHSRDASADISTYTIDSTEQISDDDWAMLRDSAKPNGVADAEWNNFWQSKQAGIGSTWGDYTKLVHDLSAAYTQANETVTDASQFFSRWYADTNSVSFEFHPKSFVSGQINDSNGQAIKGVSVGIYKLGYDENGKLSPQFIATSVASDDNGNFIVRGIESGNYLISMNNEYLFTLSSEITSNESSKKAVYQEITVNPEKNVDNLKLIAFNSNDSSSVAPSPSFAGAKDVKTIVDFDGVSHIFWLEQNLLQTAYFDGTKWIDGGRIATVTGTYDIQSQSNLIDGKPGLIVTWDNGAGNNAEVYYSLGRVNSQGYEWSKPLSITNDVVSDERPVVAIDNNGTPLIVYQKFDINSTNTNDSKHLYYQTIGVKPQNLVWLSSSKTVSNLEFLCNVYDINTGGFEFNPPKFLPDWLKRILPNFKKVAYKYSEKENKFNCDSARIERIYQFSGDFPDIKVGRESTKATFDFTIKQSTNFTTTGSGNAKKYEYASSKLAGILSGGAEFSTSNIAFGPPQLRLALAVIDRIAKSIDPGSELQIGTDATLGFQATYEVKAPDTLLSSPPPFGKGREKTKYDYAGRLGIFLKLKGSNSNFELKGGGSLAFQYGNSNPDLKIAGRAYAEIKVNLNFIGIGAQKSENYYVRRWAIELGNTFLSFLTTDDSTTSQVVNTSNIITTESIPLVFTPIDYGSNSIVSDVYNDASSDSPATIIKDSNGKLVSSWLNKGDPRGSYAGDSILVSNFDGVHWSQPVRAFYSERGVIDKSTIVLDKNNRQMVIWSMSDPSYTYTGPTITTDDQLIDAIKAIGSTNDIYYSIQDVDGSWMTASKVEDLPGKDTNFKIGKTAEGNNVLTWINDSNGTLSLESSFWNGFGWTSPTTIVRGNLANASISVLAGKTTAFWSQISIDSSTESIYYSSFDTLFDSWSIPVLFDVQTTLGNNPQNLVFDLPANINDDIPPGYFPEEDCKDPKDPKVPPYNPDGLAPGDPNDIIGPTGYGVENWINTENPLDYTIKFENVASATAPARFITITQQLDSDLDWRSFRLDSFSWGDTFITIPENSAFLSQRIDVRSQYGVYVDISATIDIRTGIAKWELRAIDPKTGDIPIDPNVGFLPPTDPKTPGNGDGLVSYHINAKQGLTTGTIIDAQASIVFDNNEAIDTPKIFHTLDTVAPTSTVNVLQTQSNDPTFQLSWTGSDDTTGSGIAGYAVFISVNGEPYELLDTVTGTELTFEGEAGNNYSFYTLAIDNTGNVQSEATSPTTAITIGGPGVLSFTTAEYSINESGAAIAAVTVQRTNGTIGAISATVALANGIANGGTQPFQYGIDFNNSPIVVNFADGETSKVITIPVNNDNLAEINETVALSLTKLTGGATLGSQATAQLTILDSNIQIGFSRTNFKVKEDGSAVNEIQVVRNGRIDVAVGATLSLRDITASAGQDYTGTPIQVDFAPGETVKTITVPIVNDTLAEGDETINLQLSNSTNGAALSTTSQAALTIVDDETNLKFNLSADKNIDAQALAGFTNAANNWSKILTNKVGLNVSIAYQDLGAGIVSQTVAEYANYSYAAVYAALNKRKLSADDIQAVASLQTGSDFNLLINNTSNSPNGNGSSTPYLDNNHNANNSTIRLNRANAKALGLLAANDSGTDATITFNSNSSIKWDFNPTDGITTGNFDFVGAVTHELGHSLGFESGVDVLDSNKPAADKDYTYISILDLFRFSADSLAQGKGVIDFTTSKTDKYFSLDGGITKIASFATGVKYGDGQQPQHWKDGLALGLLDPTIASSERGQISELDKRALDVIGWDITNAAIDRPKTVKNDFGKDYKSDILWRNTDGRVVIWQMDGVNVLSDVLINRPAPLDWQIVSTGDFDGDSKSDILWRNIDSRVVVWQMDGATVLSDKFIDRPAPLDWQIVSTDDFDGDSKSDILWRNTDGRVVIWQMDGVKVLSDKFIDRPAPLDWQIVSTADFNGDGKSDILWRNDDGRVVIWQIDGATVLSDKFINQPAPLDWQIVSTNDFNGDGKSDILWRNIDGRVVIWQIDGVNVLSDKFIDRPAPLDWQITGTSDFNGDSKSDILWRNIDGRVVVWQMDGTTVLSDRFIDRPATLDWQIAAPVAGLGFDRPKAVKNDFGKDYKSDILWRNNDGRVVIWKMDGATVISDKFIDRPAPLDWQIVSTGDFDGDKKSDILWRNTDGRVVIWRMDGVKVLSDKFIDRPAPLDWQIVSTGDFNGDKKSDILWRNDDGRVVIWKMDGATVLSDKFIDRPAPLDWQIVSTDDFNGDGKSDILWRNNDGRVVIWQMDGVKVLSDTFVDRSAPLDWQIAGTGDFNGDRKSDILWRNNDGRVVIWQMNGSEVVSDAFIDRAAPLDWQIAGTVDLNGDGKSDILWRNNDGRVVEWLLDGSTVLADNYVANVDNSWQIVAPTISLPIEKPTFVPELPKPIEPNAVKNDFGKDYKSDILWRNTDGRVVIWQMNGSEVISDTFIDSFAYTGGDRPAPLDWQIASTGDFNGDKKSDILWRNNDGRVVIWQMNGNEVLSDTLIDRPAPLDWQIAGTGDFNGDKKSDILWRNNDGRVVIWQMDGTAVLSDTFIDRPAPLDWQIAGTGDFNGDKKSDILWRNTDGRVAIWQMDGATVLSDTFIDRPISNDWVIEGVDDFNNDGKSDILWRNSNSGLAYIYEMNNNSIINEGIVGQADVECQVAGTGDYNGDTHADILWRNDSGLTYLWTMNGLNQLGQKVIKQVDNSWQISAPIG
jgi:Calx-beta domain/CARDB/FG-GAP-like repeat